MRALGLLALLLSVLGGCGGPSNADPKTPEQGETPPASASAGHIEAAEAATGPQKPTCSDGSCFECGAGICPSAGYYCEAAKAGATAGCAWAASCIQKPTCACLAPSVKGCSCEDRGGVAFVTCGG